MKLKSIFVNINATSSIVFINNSYNLWYYLCYNIVHGNSISHYAKHSFFIYILNKYFIYQYVENIKAYSFYISHQTVENMLFFKIIMNDFPAIYYYYCYYYYYYYYYCLNLTLCNL